MRTVLMLRSRSQQEVQPSAEPAKAAVEDSIAKVALIAAASTTPRLTRLGSGLLEVALHTDEALARSFQRLVLRGFFLRLDDRPVAASYYVEGA
jgi:hypothetical protein